MIQRCKNAGLPEPEIRVDAGSFVLTIRRKTTEAVPQSPPKKAQVEAQVEAQVGTKLALSSHQVEILRKCLVPSPIGDLMEIAGRTDRTKFRDQILNPMLGEDLICMTVPDKPTSRLQKYHLTEKGRALLAELEKQGGRP